MIVYPHTPRGVRSALEALGHTAEQVATNLGALGFRGVRNDCDTCPLALYLAVVFPGVFPGPAVGKTDEGIFVGDIHVDHTVGSAAFITRYDDGALGAFPELEPDHAA